MKKVFLAVAVAGMIGMTSCKKDKQEQIDETIVETTDSNTEDGEEVATVEVKSDLPVLETENEDMKKFSTEYTRLAEELKAAATSGDQDKVIQLQEKVGEMTSQIQEFTQNLSAEEAEALKKWVSDVNESLTN